jgi:hypothetical protein
MSGPPGYKITAAEVWEVLQAAEVRCERRRSLALEQRRRRRCGCLSNRSSAVCQRWIAVDPSQ